MSLYVLPLSYILPLSPNDHPTAQGPPDIVGGHPKIMIFQPTHAGLKTASLVGRHREANLGKAQIAPRASIGA